MVLELNQVTLGLLALGMVVLLWAGWRLKRWWQAVRLGRSRRQGARGESRALKLLARHGYALVNAQETMVGRFVVDGEAHDYDLRADAVVEKNGERLVAEVKTGAAAALTSRATRRQLLEYAYTFRLDGVLLVDMAAERIYRIDFPDLRR